MMGFNEEEFSSTADEVLEQVTDVSNNKSEDGDLSLDVVKRLEIASYYMAMLNDSLFENNSSESASIVEKEVKAFIRDRLELLVGIKKDQKSISSTFNEQEVQVLKMLINKVLGKPSLITKPENKLASKPPTLKKVQSKISTSVQKVKEAQTKINNSKSNKDDLGFDPDQYNFGDVVDDYGKKYAIKELNGKKVPVLLVPKIGKARPMTQQETEQAYQRMTDQTLNSHSGPAATQNVNANMMKLAIGNALKGE